jgi:uncharacterized damage-inducible protein DinB
MENTNLTDILLKMWLMSRTRLTTLLPEITKEKLAHKVHPDSNSIGHLLRHIAEVEHLFAKNVFGLDIRVKIQTVGPMVRDKGHFTNLEELISFLDEAQKVLKEAIVSQRNEDYRSFRGTAASLFSSRKTDPRAP